MFREFLQTDRAAGGMALPANRRALAGRHNGSVAQNTRWVQGKSIYQRFFSKLILDRRPECRLSCQSDETIYQVKRTCAASLQRALAAFRREIENSPQHLLARLGIAGILVETDPAAGLPYAQQAVELAPGLAEAHYLLGMLLLSTGALEKAIAELETAQHRDPADARVYFALGRAYAMAHRTKDAARARAEFARLSKENPK